MGKENNLTDFLTDVANAIRAKKGTTEKINPQNFSEEIRGIESGWEWKFIADISTMKDSYIVSGRSYLGMRIDEYNYVIAYIKNKTDGYKCAATFVDEMYGNALYDSKWLTEVNSPYIYFLPVNYTSYKYIRFPFTNKSDKVLSIDEIEENFDIRIYGIIDANYSVPEGVTVIESTTSFNFFNKTISIPPTVISIKSSSFRGCTLTSSFIFSKNIPTIDTTALPATQNAFSIYVPDESVEAYKSATNWSAYADRIKPMSEYQPNNE